VKRNDHIKLKEINSTLKEIKNSLDTPHNINFDAPLKIAAEAPLQVNLIEGEKTKMWKSVLMVFVFLVFAMSAVLSAFYSIPRKSVILNSTSRTIVCRVDYPLYVGYDDEREIELILTNKSRETSISGVKALLIYPDELPIFITSNKGSSISYFDTLGKNETKTKMITFYLNPFMDSDKIKFKLRVISDNGIEIPDKSYTIDYIDLPLIKKIFFWFFTTFLSTLGIILLSILSEKAKKMF